MLYFMKDMLLKIKSSLIVNQSPECPELSSAQELKVL